MSPPSWSPHHLPVGSKLWVLGPVLWLRMRLLGGVQLLLWLCRLMPLAGQVGRACCLRLTRLSVCLSVCLSLRPLLLLGALRRLRRLLGMPGTRCHRGVGLLLLGSSSCALPGHEWGGRGRCSLSVGPG